MTKKAALATLQAVLNPLSPEHAATGDLPLQPVTMSTILCLQKIRSGVIQSDDSKTFSMRDIANALFVLTQPIQHVRSLIACSEFEAAVDVFCDSIPASLLPKLGGAINTHIAAAFGAK
jgi:hypothetical protein